VSAVLIGLADIVFYILYMLWYNRWWIDTETWTTLISKFSLYFIFDM